MGRVIRHNWIVLSVLWAAAGLSRIVQARATLVRSEPAADEILGLSPDELRLWFSEAVDVQFSHIQLYDKLGQAINGSQIGLHGDPGDNTNPPPPNLRNYLARGFTDRQLYEQISQGRDNTTMPAFEGRLDEGERWDIINYLRTLVGKP